MDATTLRPLGPWALVKLDPPEEKRGSLYLPQGNFEEKVGNATGVVVSLGQGVRTPDKVHRKTGKKYIAPDLKIGARVVFRGGWAKQPAFDVGREYALLNVGDIYGELISE
jgi:hypothetical protein